MLAYLPPLFFFAALMGSPVVGFFVFTGLGVVHGWQSWRQPQAVNAFRWTREDSWLALCFMSIPLFKLLTLLWSTEPRLALGNVAWHLYFLFWPLVLLGLALCKATQRQIDRGLALGLILASAVSVYLVMVLGHAHSGALGNVGITAQLLMVLGGWNLLALTRPGQNRPDQALYAAAFLATCISLVLTTRRLELLGFAALSFAFVLVRVWHKLSPSGRWWLLVAAILASALFLGLRWEKFAAGFAEIQLYFERRAQGAAYQDSSWGARLEMWRLGLQGWLQHPWLGLSASARPYAMPGAAPMEIFGHRHFHSHLMQTLVEGGVLGLLVLALSLGYSIRQLIIQAWTTRREEALLAACLLGAYALEGSASAALVYDKPNALLVVASAWCWLRMRESRHRG